MKARSRPTYLVCLVQVVERRRCPPVRSRRTSGRGAGSQGSAAAQPCRRDGIDKAVRSPPVCPRRGPLSRPPGACRTRRGSGQHRLFTAGDSRCQDREQQQQLER